MTILHHIFKTITQNKTEQNKGPCRGDEEILKDMSKWCKYHWHHNIAQSNTYETHSSESTTLQTLIKACYFS